MPVQKQPRVLPRTLPVLVIWVNLTCYGKLWRITGSNCSRGIVAQRNVTNRWLILDQPVSNSISLNGTGNVTRGWRHWQELPANSQRCRIDNIQGRWTHSDTRQPVLGRVHQCGCWRGRRFQRSFTWENKDGFLYWEKKKFRGSQAWCFNLRLFVTYFSQLLYKSNCVISHHFVRIGLSSFESLVSSQSTSIA